MQYIPIIGLMSGTSIDGIDASLIYSNGSDVKKTNFNIITPYKRKTKDLLFKCYQDPLQVIEDKLLKSHIEKLITIEHTNSVKKLIKLSGIKPKLIGFHGQTIFHDPWKKVSIQLGNPRLMANLLKIKIVNDFRKNDMENGGQGAPLAPIYHKKLLEQLQVELPGVMINIGGITNITYWDGQKLLGFDTGPGNNLMDNLMQNIFNKSYDKDGSIANRGIPNLKLIKSFCDDPFLKKPPPKSLDRSEMMNNEFYQKILNLKPVDAMATLSLLTAETIKTNFQFLPFKPKTVIIVGGGQHNKTLIENIKKSLKLKIYLSDEIGLLGDFIEAELIGFLTARKFYNLPSTFNSTTGSITDVINGSIIDFEN